MKHVSSYINEIITQGAIQHRIKHAIHHGIKEEEFFYSNIHKLMDDYVEREARSKARRHHLDYELCLMHETHAAATQFMEDMQREDGQLTFDKDNFKPPAHESKFIRKVRRQARQEKAWDVFTTSAECNYFDWSCMRRVHNTHVIFKLLHVDGAEAIFHEPEEGAGSTHLIMLWLPLEYQGSYFYLKKRFKEVCQLIAFDHGLSLFSPCLSSDMKEYPARQPDRRFEKTPLEGYSECYRLLKTYLRLGGHLPKLDGFHPNTLFFAHPNKVLEAKKVIMSVGDLNPFMHARNTIYERNLEIKLLG